MNKNSVYMEKNTFVISDESVNSYGYIVKTDGIDTTAFERNPVMLYMHERKTVVGRWENIRKEGNKLLADAVFDESTELGKTVKAQVENGFLRSASIGVDIIEDTIINGVTTVTKSSLFEISIVDIPANKNALKLYRKGSYKRLALETPKEVTDLRAEIITLLGLSEDASDEDIIGEIQTLLNAPDEASAEVENAIRAGFVESKDRGNFVTMTRISPKTFNAFVAGESKKRSKAIEAALEVAIHERRITYQQSQLYRTIAEKLGMETLSELLRHTIIVPKLSKMISGDRSGWTLKEWRIFAPEQLKDNPKLYAELIAADKEKSINNGKHTLEYLRKHDPEYLREHPEVYKKLLTNI